MPQAQAIIERLMEEAKPYNRIYIASIHADLKENDIQRSVCLSECLSVCLSVYLSVCLYVCLSVCLYVCLSACLYVCLSVCLFVCVSVCLSVFLRLFIFRHSG